MKKTNKAVTYFQKENDVFISLKDSEGNYIGEFSIINTHLGFMLNAYDDSWKILSDFTDLFDLLGSQSMEEITMKQLAEMIRDIGYELIMA